MKFGDVIMATVSSMVLFIILFAILTMGLVPAAGYSGLLAAAYLSEFVSGSVVGYVFAKKIREDSRMKSIAKIFVLVAFVVILITLLHFATVGHYKDMVDENLSKMYSISSNTDWYVYETMSLYVSLAVNSITESAFIFIGLCLGSMRKPSAKTKE